MDNKRNQRIIIIIVFLVIAAIVLIVSAVKKNKGQDNTINVIVKNSYNTVNNISPMKEVEVSDEFTNEVRRIYLDDIRNGEVINLQKIDDYKINKIDIVSDEQKSNILKMDVGSFYKQTDTFAIITYSVKPNNLDSSLLNLGTGVQNGDWITFEDVCVCIRDGEVISAGTSW